mmetsp:Transcript_1853/g.6828  ORF Transcript_1853/g.6828 Transcript_1853/m.6828 type:complete len:215 (-) Transcript_1853:1668-2312(-)
MRTSSTPPCTAGTPSASVSSRRCRLGAIIVRLTCAGTPPGGGTSPCWRSSAAGTLFAWRPLRWPRGGTTQRPRKSSRGSGPEAALGTNGRPRAPAEKGKGPCKLSSFCMLRGCRWGRSALPRPRSRETLRFLSGSGRWAALGTGPRRTTPPRRDTWTPCSGSARGAAPGSLRRCAASPSAARRGPLGRTRERKTIPGGWMDVGGLSSGWLTMRA